MGGESRYGVKAPRVVYEVFDEEVVVLDLESGSYYSLRASAAWIFQAAAGGASSGAIAAAFASRGNDDPADVHASPVREVHGHAGPSPSRSDPRRGRDGLAARSDEGGRHPEIRNAGRRHFGTVQNEQS